MKKVRLFLLLLMVAMLPLAMQAQQSLPYSYGFENNDLSADGWTIVNGAIGYSYSTGIDAVAARSGDYGFMFYFSSNPPQYLISPELTGTENGVDVEFFYQNPSTWSETFQVGYSTTDADVNSFTWEGQVSALSSWTPYNTTFPAGTKYVAVKYTADDQFKMYIDDIAFSAPSACPKPAGLAPSSVAANSATLIWDAVNATSWTLEYSTSATFTDAISVEVTGSPSKTIEDLSAQTKYYVRVKADCGDDGESDWCNPINFTTPCGTVVVTGTVPFHEGFETYGDFGCWTAEIVSGSYNWSSSSYYSTEGNYSACLSSSADEAWLISPVLDLTQMTTPQLTFYHRQSPWYGNADELHLYYRTAATEEWTLIESFTDSYSSFTLEKIILPNPSATYQIAFVGICDNNYGVYLDDVNIIEAPTCFPPTTVEVATASINPRGATISWEGGATPAPENGWVLLVNNEEVSVDVNPYTFTTLTPETSYTVRVKSVCSDTDTSEVSTASASFVTLPICPAPTGLVVVEGSETTNGVTLSWNPGGEEAEWIIHYNDNDTTVNENPFTFDNLTPSTHYTVKVKAVCSDTDSSSWSNTKSFDTDCDVVVVTEENPFIEKFNNNGMCWTPNDYVTGSTSWQIVSYISDGGYSFSGLYDGPCAKFYSASSTQKTRAISPVMDLTALDNARLTFQMANPSYSGDVNRLKIYYRLSEDSEWVQIDSIGDAHGTWTPMLYPLTVTSATFQLAFEGSNNTGYNYGYAIFLDDIVVEQTPACFVPTNLTLDTVATTFFQLSWNDNNEETPASWTVAYSIDGGETFTEIANIDSDSAVVCNFDATLGDANVIAKVKAHCDAENASRWSDPLEFVTPPTCPKPTDLAYSNVTSNSVILSWTAGSDEDEWILELNGNENVVDLNTITIDTLTANTPYVVRVRALCGEGDTSLWSTGFVGFVTLCEPLTAEDYSENFNNYTATEYPSASDGVMPDCWNYIGTNGSYRPHVYNGSYSPTDSNNSLVLTSGDGDSYGGNTNIAVMPVFNDLTGKQLSFATAMENASHGTLTVGYVTDLTAASFVELETVPNNGYNSDNRYVTHEVIVSTVPANARIAFKWFNDYLWYSCAIDDITIVDMPACAKPIAVTVPDSTLTATSAVIAWTDPNLTTPEQGWIIHIYDEDTTVMENPFTFDNLDPETDYTVKIKALCTDTTESEWSEEITFTTFPTCIAPVTVSVPDSTIMATSAVVYWTDRNVDAPEKGWIININGEDTTVTENPFTFDNLEASTSYTIKIASFCSETDTSAWSNSVSFTTLCDVVVVTEDVPYQEGFENDAACWHMENISGDYNWIVYESSTYAFEGSHVALAPYQPGNVTRLISPLFDLTALENPMFTFMRLQKEWVEYGDTTLDEMDVYYRTSPSGEWVLLANYFTANTEYEQETFFLPNPSATYQISFVATGHDGNNILLDDINVLEAPTCFKPSEIVFTDITTTAVTIDWTDNNETTPQSWTIHLGQIDTTVTEHPFTIDNLTAATQYTVQVKANCTDEDASEWSFEKVFATECDVMSANDYSEDFSNYTGTEYEINTNGVMPLCWNYLYDGEEDGAKPHIYNGSYAVTADNNCLLMLAGVYENWWSYDYYDFGTNSYAIMPEFDNLSGKQINFTYTSSYGYGTLTFGYLTDETNASTFVEMETLPTATIATEYEISVENVPAGARMAFKWTYSYYDDFDACAIDNITITDLPPCRKPTDVRVTVTSGNSAIIDWTDNNETAPQSWTISLGEIDTTVTEHPFTFDNLTASTYYTVAVKANCTDEDMSAWSAEESFNTPCDVIVVTDYSPYFEGFEAENLCWDNENEEWDFGTNYNYSSAYEGASYSYFSGSSFTVYTSKLTSPIFDITNVTAPYISFAHAQAAWDDDQNILRVLYRSSAAEEWTVLAEYDNSITTWQVDTIALPNPSATYQIAFEGEAYYGRPIAVDAVNIFNSGEAHCFAPTNVAVENGVVTWSGGAANYNVKITVANEVVIDTTVNTTSYTIEGLEEGTHATVIVQAVCTEEELSEWSEAVEFDYTVGINNYTIHANIYPNPTTGHVTVESNAINADITVFDMFGKLLMTSKVASERTELNFSNFAPGVYVVRIANATATTTIKVVKE